eukprot:CAMPEP_0169271624 /NCGR_PEP_ID=MMETSP1016-20121227/49894_1 /TAXON_ID=342587 /ORGANISM="Karlodinium micrum, Strain CCMP2283" /LENGTH=71 /DNA_ID=CAMNT_0009357337 /DNA_START=79 /DNA_END=291 /DNA_ORIENTATION=-
MNDLGAHRIDEEGDCVNSGNINVVHLVENIQIVQSCSSRLQGRLPIDDQAVFDSRDFHRNFNAVLVAIADE